MALKFTGAFLPLPKVSVKYLAPTFVPFVVPNARFANYTSYVYEGAKGFSIGADRATVTGNTTASSGNIAFTTPILGGLTYFEWKIQQIETLANVWVGLIVQSPSSNVWMSAYAPTNASAAILTGDGRLYGSGTLLGRPFPEGLKAGDTVGFAMNGTGRTGTSFWIMSVHVNGVWRRANGSPLTVEEVSSQTGGSGNTAITATVPLFMEAGGSTPAAKLTATLNSGQLESKWKPASYSWPYSLNGDIGFNAGYGMTQVDHNTVQMTSGAGSNFNARSDRPIPTGAVPFYFEVTTTKVWANTRIGFRYAKAPETQRLGAGSGFAEEGFEVNTNKFYVYGNNSPLQGATPSTAMTFGIARQSNKVWIRDSNRWITGGDPSTKTGGSQVYSDTNQNTFFAVSEITAGATWTLNTGKTPFTYSLPTGFQAWNDIQY